MEKGECRKRGLEGRKTGERRRERGVESLEVSPANWETNDSREGENGEN